MGYYVYTVDDLEKELEDIKENLENVENYLYDAIYGIDNLKNDYDYYNGSNYYEDLTTYEYVKDVVNKFNDVNKKMLEFQEQWNDKIKKIKENAEYRFQDFYENAIIEVKK